MKRSEKIESGLLSYLREMKARIPAKRYEQFICGVLELARIHATPFLAETSVGEEGRAYLVFRSESSIQEIREGLPVLRDVAGVPTTLELAVIENPVLPLKELLTRGSLSTPKVGNPYIVEGKLRNATNQEVCRHLGHLVSTLCDWDTVANQAPFHEVEGIGECYYQAGGRFLESNY